MKKSKANPKRPIKLRKRTEELLNKNPAVIKKIPPMDVRNLLEDLQIYQIELEKYNNELQKVHKQLQDSEEEYRQLFSTVSDAVMVFDAETKEFIDANDSVSSYYGYSKEEFLRLKQTDITAELEKSDDSIKKTVSGEISSIPLRYHKRKDGTIFPVEISTGAFTLGKRQMVYGVVRDITERKQTEEALKKSEKRYRAVVESQTEMICRFFPDGTLTFVNEAYCRYFDKGREELIGHDFMPLIPESDRDKVSENIASLNPNTPVITIEHQVLAPNGEICWHKWTNRAIFDDKSNLVEYQSVGWDITNRVRVEEALQKAHDELERRVEERTKELDVKTQDLEELNAALNVLLNKRQEDQEDFQEGILTNIKTLIEPYLDKLKKSKLTQNQKTLLNILESNLNEIVSPFTKRLSSKFLNLTPKEIKIATLVKHGKTNKEIAEIQGVASRTIAAHRENIRNKLGLTNKKANLKTYLQTIE